ncbi:MAG: hypothetical protein WDZ54_00070 [Sneathiella sp.]
MPDTARWLNENFSDWAILSNQEKKAIRDFPILWSMFELYATGQNGTRPNADPPAIRRAVEHLVVNFDVDVIRQARDHFSARYFEDGIETYAFQQLRVHRNDQQLVRDMLLGENVQGQRIFLGLLLIINRLRNNFLHGEKARYTFDGQLENFRHANRVLMFAIPLWSEP